MKDFISSNGGLIGSIVLVLMVVNALIVGLHSALGVLIDKIPGDTDKKLYDWTGTALTWIQKILELIGAYKPAPKADDGNAPKS